MKFTRLQPLSVCAGILVGVSALHLMSAAQTTQVVPTAPSSAAGTPVARVTAEQLEILSHMSLVFLDDGAGGSCKTIRIEGVNVQIVNGLGATNGYPADPTSVDPLDTVTNCGGNLIVGYNEPGNPVGDVRTGSHNVVVGHRNNYAGFGGAVLGRVNTGEGAYATVTGGAGNVASGASATVTGGLSSTAAGDFASVTGGRANLASGDFCTVAGGNENEAGGMLASTVMGGRLNRATGFESTVCGGRLNLASGDIAAVSGGRDNLASGFAAVVCGGMVNVAQDSESTVEGGCGVVSTGACSVD